MMEWLYQKGADINAKAEDGRTPLMIALLEKKKKAINFFISKGASMNDISYYGETIKQLARQTLDPDIVNLLSNTQPNPKTILPLKKYSFFF